MLCFMAFYFINYILLSRWCKLIRPEKLAQVVVLEMKDITKEMFLENQDSLDKLKELGFTMVSSLRQNKNTCHKKLKEYTISQGGFLRDWSLITGLL